MATALAMTSPLCVPAAPAAPWLSKTKYAYTTQGWGEELAQVVADPDTAQLTTSYTYDTKMLLPATAVITAA